LIVCSSSLAALGLSVSTQENFRKLDQAKQPIKDGDACNSFSSDSQVSDSNFSGNSLIVCIPATRNGFKQLKTEETVEQGVFGDRQAIEPGVVSLWKGVCDS
jgi:hypothetical protein